MFWEKYGIEKKDLLTPASVLIGAILISLSIFYAGGVFSSVGNTANSGQAQNSGEEVKVAKRDGAASEGSGKVEIVMFSDFQCPYCQRFFNEAYKQIKSKYIDTNKVKFTFRHYPLPFHQNAQKAGEAAECAGKQNKFWPYHDILFTQGQSDGTGLAISDLKRYAGELGLDQTKFNTCLDNGEMADVVKADLAEAQKIGVSGTPSFYIDGTPVVGALPFSSFEEVIEKALK